MARTTQPTMGARSRPLAAHGSLKGVVHNSLRTRRLALGRGRIGFARRTVNHRQLMAMVLAGADQERQRGAWAEAGGEQPDGQRDLLALADIERDADRRR
jgi:hypothetical protein